MTVGTLPDGFAVRLHDDVQVGSFLTSGARVVRLSAAARQVLNERAFTVTSPVTSRLAGRLLDLDLADPVLTGVPGPGLAAVTVVVPVRDNADGVERLLKSLATSVTCIVVDDASGDPAALAAVVRQYGARLIRLEENVGPAAARNAGLREVRSPFVAFVDSDVDVAVAALSSLLGHLVDPAVALVAPRVRSQGGGRWLGRYEEVAGSLDLGGRAATIRTSSSVGYVPSACLVARVAALGSGFDVDMRSGEDVDLVWRVDAAGYRVRYAAEIVVRHDARTSTRAWLARKAFYGTSAAPLAARHGDRVAPAVLSPATALAVAALVCQRRWSLAVAGVSVVAAVRTGPSLPPDLPHRARVELARSAGAGAVRQSTSLVLRHWSPATLALCLVSRRARRAATFLAVADGLLAHRRAGTDLDVVHFVLARRGEDLAYGFGVWWGAARARSVRCLTPRWVRSSPQQERRS